MKLKTEKKFDVLVTDSELKHSLATVRCLGKHKLKLITCSSKFSPTKFSKYSGASFRYKEKELIKPLLKKLKQNKISVVMPIGYYSNILCSKNKKEIEKYSKILISDYQKMGVASDKEKMAKLIKKIGIPCPKTFVVKNLTDAKKVIFNQKMIIKSSKEMRGKKVEYIEKKELLMKKIKERLVYGTQIVQEYIEGFGCGFFALCKNGKILTSFQHKRIRDYPYSGGISSCAESFYNLEVEKMGTMLLEKLNWDGIAMVEFRFDEKNKKFKFIELNAKFWGSLDLAISSGVEFPYLYYLACLGRYFEKSKYRKTKFQWILPEDTLRIKTAPSKIEALKEYFSDLFDHKTKKDIDYLFKDPIPTILRIFATKYRFIFQKEK